MASASILFSEEQFSCPICWDVFTSPVVTPCGDTFCKACITTCWDGQVQYKCPLCNEVFHTRPDLRVNEFLSGMADRFRSVEDGGVWRQTPGLRKYACELTLDPNTANRRLSLSEDNREVTWATEEQSYPDHPDRFIYWEQVLCREGLTGRCYWEVEMKGCVEIGVTYRGITTRGDGDDSRLGGNNQSWCLYCYDDDDGYHYSAWYNNISTDIRLPRSSVSTRVGVYVDCSAGTLSFYRVSPHVGGSSGTLTHIHTFQTTFTQTLYPGVGLWGTYGSSVSLCQL